MLSPIENRGTRSRWGVWYWDRSAAEVIDAAKP